jgi:hypothetical protein
MLSSEARSKGYCPFDLAFQCDQQKPRCGGCQKRDRSCSYSYGRVSGFVVEDPLQLSKYGKSIGAPLICPLVTWNGSGPESPKMLSPSSASVVLEDLRVTTEKGADNGNGTFLTLAVPSKENSSGVRKSTAQQKRRLENHLKRLRESFELTTHRLSSPESTLSARYLNILGRRPFKDQPFALLGSWIQTIPSRIGSSQVVDLAIEYFADSFAVFRGDNFSNRTVALATKAKALKQLQLVVSDDRTRATYNTALAMKLHFMSEVCVLMFHI